MTEPVPALIPSWPTIPGIKFLLMGPAGSGKTYSLRTLMNTELEVFAIFTDPHAMALFTDTDPERFHWVYVSPANPSWTALVSNAMIINNYSYEDIAKRKDGMNKSDYAQFLTLLNTCANYKCQRTGKEYGPIDNFDTHKVVVVDHLTGLSIMARDLTIGAKPALHMGEWNVAMNQVERIITQFTANLMCHFILLAHIDKQTDEIALKSKLVVNTLGHKLAPTIPANFADFVLAVKEGNKFKWNTLSAEADLKAQNLPMSDSLPPDFVPLIQRWKQRV